MSNSQVIEVTLYVCDECGYFRTDYSTGRHQTSNPKDAHGPMVTHDVKPVQFVRKENDR